MKFYNLNAYRGSNSMVRIIGHRGARGLYPENSLLGFMNVLKSAIEIAVKGYERIQLTPETLAVSSQFIFDRMKG